MATNTRTQKVVCTLVKRGLPPHSQEAIDICLACKRKQCVLATVPAVQKACRFLQEFLANGPQQPYTVRTAAAKRGISKRTLARAKAQLQIEARWTWLLSTNGKELNSNGKERMPNK